jgi:hypothetical protein
MHLSIHVVPVHLGLEGELHLPYVAAELDKPFARGNIFHEEALLAQPAGDLSNIGVVHAKMGAELVRRHPLVEVCMSTIKLLVE